MIHVELLHSSPLSLAHNASRTAYRSTPLIRPESDDLPESYRSYIYKIGRLLKHESVLEHLTYSLLISGISRSLLQQWSRNRIMSQTVNSTRYIRKERLSLCSSGNGELDDFILSYFEQLKERFGDLPNDVLKYAYPEAIETQTLSTLNARELLHIFSLRTKPTAMHEYRLLCCHIYNALPAAHKYLFSEYF